MGRAKGQLRGSLVLGLEDTGSRMSRIGKGELSYGEYLTVEQTLERIDAVTAEEVAALAAAAAGASRRHRGGRALRAPGRRAGRSGEVIVVAARGTDDPIRVGVLGARGRMGAEVCRAVEAADDMDARREDRRWVTGCSTSPTRAPRWSSTSPTPTP